MLGQGSSGRLEEGAAPRRGIPPVPRAPGVDRRARRKRRRRRRTPPRQSTGPAPPGRAPLPSASAEHAHAAPRAPSVLGLSRRSVSGEWRAGKVSTLSRSIWTRLSTTSGRGAATSAVVVMIRVLWCALTHSLSSMAHGGVGTWGPTKQPTVSRLSCMAHQSHCVCI